MTVDPSADYKAINAIGDQIAAFRNNDESAVVIAFGSHANLAGCPNGSLSVTVSKKGFTATSEALRLGDAALMARGKVNRMIESHEKELEKEKSS